MRVLHQVPELLRELADGDDPFASAAAAHTPGVFPGIFTTAVELVRAGRRWITPEWSKIGGASSNDGSTGTTSESGSIAGGGTAAAPAPAARRGVASPGHRFSHELQMELPAPWDAINMSTIVRCVTVVVPEVRPEWAGLPAVPCVSNITDACMGFAHN